MLTKKLTKQVASYYLYQRLCGVIPDHDELRDMAERDLTQDECYQIVEEIITQAEKMYRPLHNYLKRTGSNLV